MKPLHWYVGILIVAAAIGALAVEIRLASRYRCESVAHESAMAVCVDNISGTAEYVTATNGSFAAVRWRIAGDDSAGIRVVRLPDR